MVIIQIPFLSLDKMYESCFPPRWIKLREGKYIIINADKAVKVEQKKERFIFNCSDEEFFQTWFHYFDLSYDYARAYYRAEVIDKDLKTMMVRARGIRNIKHPLIETIYSVAMLRDNPGFFEDNREFLVSLCGDVKKNSMQEAGKVKWYATPSFEKVCKSKTLADEFPFLAHVASKLLHITSTIDSDINDWSKKRLGLSLLDCDFTKEEIRLIFSLCLGTNSIISSDLLEHTVDLYWECDWETFSEWFLSNKDSFLVAQCILWNVKNNKVGI